MISVIITVVVLAVIASLFSPTESIHDPRITHDCEMQYGEICYRCEEVIGDPEGEPRLCVACTRNDRISTITDP
jgi:hypothetical protein